MLGFNLNKLWITLLSSCEILQVLMGWAGCHGGWGIYNIDVKHFKKKMNYILEKGAV